MKRYYFLLLVFSGILMSCGSSKKMAGSSGNYKTALMDDNAFELNAIADDDTYGYTPENPILVGGVKNSEGPLNERRFLNALLGPNGEKITYYRQGSCCPFKSANGLMGSGLLDRYEVTIEGQEKKVIIYINMYDAGPLKAPKGFTFKM